jgi:PST family polysaccharide transporter
MGSSSVVSILAGIAKNKLIALLLGPQGIGLFGLLQAIQTTASTAVGLGLSSSGIRQIARTEAEEGPEGLALTYSLLRRCSAVLGLMGLAALVLLRRPIALLTLGDESYAGAIAWLGAGVWATVMAGAQTALLNGLRRLRELALVNVWGAVIGVPLSVLAVWLWKESGVSLAVAVTALSSLSASWWWSRRVAPPHGDAKHRDLAGPLRVLLTMGVTLMVTTLMTVGNQFAVRAMVTRMLGITATGHFQAAWSISMVYLGFILSAMSADYYPRLAAAAQDKVAANGIVNEQIEVALLLTGPVIVGMLAFAPQLVCLLYSSAFADTNAVLCWQILGDVFKIGSFPMAFVLLANGCSRLYFFTELAWNLTYLILVWSGTKLWGLQATGIAFLVAYIVYFILVWFLVHSNGLFLMKMSNLRLFLGMFLCAASVLPMRELPGTLSIVATGAFTVLVASYSLSRISRTIGGIPWKRLTNHRW